MVRFASGASIFLLASTSREGLGPMQATSSIGAVKGLSHGVKVASFTYICLLSTSSGPVLGPAQPYDQRVPGALSLGIMRPGRGADHSLPTNAEVKHSWIHTLTPHTSLV
jgi:hypothetical protein